MPALEDAAVACQKLKSDCTGLSAITMARVKHQAENPSHLRAEADRRRDIPGKGGGSRRTSGDVAAAGGVQPEAVKHRND